VGTSWQNPKPYSQICGKIGHIVINCWHRMNHIVKQIFLQITLKFLSADNYDIAYSWNTVYFA